MTKPLFLVLILTLNLWSPISAQKLTSSTAIPEIQIPEKSKLTIIRNGIFNISLNIYLPSIKKNWML